MKKILSLVLLIVFVGGGAGFWYWRAHAAEPMTFKTVPVKRGPLTATIGSTGTLEPLNVIDVGSQVSGMIEEFGRDPNDTSKPVDYGTQVDKGTVLAILDKSLYQAAVDQAKANLAQADAKLKQSQAMYTQADRDWSRAKDTVRTRAISDSDYDLAMANYHNTKASVTASQAAIAVAKAALATAETNLRYCTIVSKAKGVIIDRRVNIGQTVVSSLNAPSLFLIATDLSKMQVWASVNEADIGQIKRGQPVRFTVDAFPDQVFEGKVAKVRLNASMTQNVVTYTVEVDVDNAKYGNILKPYMTTNLQFVINAKKDVLQVPNGAIRWRPKVSQVAPEFRDAYAQSLQRKRKALAAGSVATTQAEKDRRNRGLVWVEEGDFVRPIKVRIGLSDGSMTEILSGLKGDEHVVIGEEHHDGGDGTSNPFAPKIFNGKKE
jgi:HlyD family secretion protein